MIGGAQDLDAAADDVGVSLAQGRVASDLEGDVPEPDLSLLWPLRRFGSRMLADVRVWKLSPNVMNTPPCSGSSSAITKPSTSR